MAHPTKEDHYDLIRETALRNTGFMARHILGFNYDKDEDTGKKTYPGGIYDHGPHEQIVRFIDNPPQQYIQVMCPRGARKTTLVVSFISRQILANPNVRILVAMKTMAQAKETVGTVREALERNERIQTLWGKQKGPVWRDDAFTVASRRMLLRDPTCRAAGVESAITGFHYDIIILDDLVDWESVRSVEQIQKGIDFLQMCYPLLDPGGLLMDWGTPYDESDVHHVCLNSNQWTSLVIPCGMEIVTGDDGGYTLEGEPNFPHLTREFLLAQLADDAMGPRKFAANYCLECSSPEDQMFYPEQFRSAYFEPWMKRLRGYVLTDTATTQHDHGSYSVVALVLLDVDDTAYLAELKVGLWQPQEFVENLMNLVEEWQHHCRLTTVVMERIALNRVYKSNVEMEKSRRGLTFKIVDTIRGIATGSKDERIMGLEPRFASGRFKVLDTVSQTFDVRGRKRVLWTPERGKTKDGLPLPGGELVDQFCRPNAKRKDIPDALADLEALHRDGRRVCAPTPPSRWAAEDGPRREPDPLQEMGHPLSWARRRRGTGGIHSLASRIRQGPPSWAQRRKRAT